MINEIDLEQNLYTFPSCIFVRGAKRGIVADLQNNKYYFVPLTLIDVVNERKSAKSIQETLNKYEGDEHVILLEYFQFLIRNDLAFLSQNENPDNFFFELEWDGSEVISNCIIDIGVNSNRNFSNVFSSLEQMGCRAIQFRCYENVTISSILPILDILKNINTRITTIEIILSHSCLIDKFFISAIYKDYPMIRLLCFCDAEQNIVHQESSYGYGLVISTTQSIKSCLSCGLILDQYFITNEELFTEAQHHNTCLNRKISIDVNGEIKNCPSMAKSYGNIKDTTLAEAIEKPGFKDLWDINKDKIHVCKDCEFRYICTDCRAYIENPEDIYSKPLKCGYNPYTAEWEEWSTNPLKQKAIEYYGMQELVKKEPK